MESKNKNVNVIGQMDGITYKSAKNVIYAGGVLLQQSAQETSSDQLKYVSKITTLGNYLGKNIGYDGTVYDVQGLAPTLKARDYKFPKEICVREWKLKTKTT